MRTVRSNVTFQRPFTLSRDVGELPHGTYDIEVDEEEIRPSERSAYRRSAIRLYVQRGASTRVVTATPKDFDAALERDSTSEECESGGAGSLR